MVKMEGFDFDDDIFGESKVAHSRDRIPEFIAQVQNSMWFEETLEKGSEDINNWKFWGDCAYMKKTYKVALEKYRVCFDLLNAHNGPLHHEICESITRCYSHMLDKEKALDMCEKTVQGASTIDQVTQALKLKTFVYGQFNMYVENVCCAEQLCILHSSDPNLWINLYHLYQDTANSITEQGSSGNYCTSKGSSDNHRKEVPYSKNILKLKQLTCLYRSQLLLKSMYKNLNSFAQQKNKEQQDLIIELLPQFDTLAEDVRKKCYQHVSDQTFGNEEDITTHGEKYLLSLLQDYKKVFTDKWYSWIQKHESTDIT